MNNVTEITCFIASPGDTSEERNACECVFEEINHGIGRSKGFRLVPLRWEKDVYPGVAEYGQQVINRQVNGNYSCWPSSPVRAIRASRAMCSSTIAWLP